MSINKEGGQQTNRRIWPWLVTGLFATTTVLFPILSTMSEDNFKDFCRKSSTITIPIFVFIVLLLLTFVCCARIHSATHLNTHFKDIFRQYFYRNWVYCIFFVLLMIGVIHCWDSFCNQFLQDGANCFFPKNRLKDIRDSVEMVCWEEAVFRVAPILSTTFVVTLVKPKWIKYLLGVICVIGIICVQLQFGALHYNPLVDESRVKPIICQGGAGFILAITYTGILCNTLNARLRVDNLELKGKIKAILVTNLLAFVASSIVHAVANLAMVFTQTF